MKMISAINEVVIYWLIEQKPLIFWTTSEKEEHIINQTWIIAIHNTNNDGICLYQKTCTKENIKKAMWDLMLKSRSEDDTFAYGTKNIESIEEHGSELYAYDCHIDHHTDYTAKPLDDIRVSQ